MIQSGGTEIRLSGKAILEKIGGAEEYKYLERQIKKMVEAEFSKKYKDPFQRTEMLSAVLMVLDEYFR